MFKVVNNFPNYAISKKAAKARRIWESKVGATTFKNTQKNIYD